jgi:hypothetical protein
LTSPFLACTSNKHWIRAVKYKKGKNARYFLDIFCCKDLKACDLVLDHSNNEQPKERQQRQPS